MAGDEHTTVDDTESQAQLFYPSNWWHDENGYHDGAWWTYEVESEEESSNWGIWGTYIETPDDYVVQVYWPESGDAEATTQARYRIYSEQGGLLEEVFVDQEFEGGMWYTLGAYEFSAGPAVVILTDWGGGAPSAVAVRMEQETTQPRVYFDAVRWATPTPTPSPTPTPTSTPTPISTTIVISISQGSDDAGHHYLCDYSTTWNEIYFGECNTGADITSGFRFTNVPLPPGATVAGAHLEFTVDGPADAPLTLTFSGEATGDAQPFTATSRPDNRPQTTAAVMWNIPASDHWELGETRHSPDLAPIVQEIVNRSDWVAYHALAFIVENAAPAAGQSRRVIGYERPTWYPGSEYGARLVIAYNDAPPPTPTPSPSPTPTPACRFSTAAASPTTREGSPATAMPRAADLVEWANLLYRVRDELLSQTAEGRRYIDLYYTHSAEIARLLLADRQFDTQGLTTLDLFAPLLQAPLDGRGDSVTITAEQVKQAELFLDALSAAGSPGLQQAIATERARRPLAHLVGLTFDQAWLHLNGYALTWLPPVSTIHPYRAQVGRTIVVQFALLDVEGDFVTDNTVTLRVLDTVGEVVVGPVGLANNHTSGMTIQGQKYHYNLRTANLPAGSYKLVVEYNALVPG
ncbi:MAG: hypothetical protein K8S14_02030, partial [Actinomycetia bacterium]|nr:hypothetical protein [Actinomycetes bacterium]